MKHVTRECAKCKASLGKVGQCRGCGTPLCSAKKCHLEHRAMVPKLFKAFQVLPPTCENQRLKVDTRATIASAAMQETAEKVQGLVEQLLCAPDDDLVIKRLQRELATAQKAADARALDYMKAEVAVLDTYRGAA